MVKVNAMSQAQLIKLLLEGTYTCNELAQQTGLHYVTVLHYCRELHKINAAHICAWDKDKRGRDLLKIYKLGPGTDAKRNAMSSAERQTRYRNKKKHGQLLQVSAGNGCFEQAANGRVAYTKGQT